MGLRMEFVSAVVEFTGQSVVISHPEGLETMGRTETTTIPLDALRDVAVMDPGTGPRGYFCLRVARPDGTVTQPTLSFLRLYRDPYAVVFERDQKYKLRTLFGTIARAKEGFEVLPLKGAEQPSRDERPSGDARQGEAEEPVEARRGAHLRTFSCDGFRIFKLYEHAIQLGGETKGLGGVTATIETGSHMTSRLTATRLALLGAYALAVPKTSGGEMYLTVEGPDFVWSGTFNGRSRDLMRRATAFRNAVNERAKLESPEGASPEGAAEEFTANLERIARLHETGALSDSEFQAAKRKLLSL